MEEECVFEGQKILGKKKDLFFKITPITSLTKNIPL
jgi:hypothetical protein